MKTTDSTRSEAPTARIGPSMPFLPEEEALPAAPWKGLLALLGFLLCLYAFTAPARAFVAENRRQQFDAGVWREQNLGSYTYRPGEFQGLFLGSSRVNRGLVPEAFDLVMRKNGKPIQTLNMGNTGMGFIEMSALVDRLIEWGLGDLEWIVIELTELDPKLEASNQGSPRYNGWHSPRATRDMLAILWDSERNWIQKIVDSYGHVIGLGAHLGGTGQAHSYWKNTYGEDRPRPPGKVARDAGYNCYPELEVVPDKPFTKVDLQLEPLPGRAPGLTPAHERILFETDRKLREAGVVPIFLRMPGFQRQCSAMQAAQQRLLPITIDACEMERYQQIYKQENFHDRIHMNDTGARQFSGILAYHVLELYRLGELRQAPKQD